MNVINVKGSSGQLDAPGTARVISIGKASRRLAAVVGVLICATFLSLPAVNAQVTNTSSASLSGVRGLFGAVATAPTGVSAVAGDGTVLVTWLAPANAASSGVTNYRVRRFAGDTNRVLAMTVVRVTRTSLLFSGLVNGRPYSFDVTAVSGTDLGAVSARSAVVGFGLPVPTPSNSGPGVDPTPTPTPTITPTPTPSITTGTTVVPSTPGSPVAPVLTALSPLALKAPSAGLIGTATAGNRSAIVRWRAPSNGGSRITGYTVRVTNAKTKTQIGGLRRASAGATSLKVTGLANGTSVRFQVRATNAVGTGTYSALSRIVRPATVAKATVIRTALSGAFGGRVDAAARWAPPSSNGGSPITGYVVIALQIKSDGTIGRRITSAVQPAGARSLRMPLASGNYRFVVRARNAVGLSAISSRSNLVAAR